MIGTGAEAALASYAELVRRWSARLDLVAPGDLDTFEERHIADSLEALPLVLSLPPGPALDVGSGAGLPGIPLAIADPTRQWRLLEPRRNRAAFLEEAVRTLALDCEVVVASAEEAARAVGMARAHPLVVARALAPPRRAFELLGPLVAPSGMAVVWVGAEAEIPAQAEVWRGGLAIMRCAPRFSS
ncbi:MAG: 16S rRNA (guanine(527)-N(7))-methyltransferase RsmG [Actinomycetota bacterium]